MLASLAHWATFCHSGSCTCGGDNLDERITIVHASICPSNGSFDYYAFEALPHNLSSNSQLACKQVLWAKVKECDPLYVPKMVELLLG